MGQTPEILDYAVTLDQTSILAWVIAAGEEENDPGMRRCLRNILREEYERYDNCTLR